MRKDHNYNIVYTNFKICNIVYNNLEITNISNKRQFIESVKIHSYVGCKYDGIHIAIN